MTTNEQIRFGSGLIDNSLLFIAYSPSWFWAASVKQRPLDGFWSAVAAMSCAQLRPGSLSMSRHIDSHIAKAGPPRHAREEILPRSDN
jgi:hypothetical protein